MSSTVISDSEINITSSPPFPRAQIDHNSLTKPVPVRGTPVSTNNDKGNETPEFKTGGVFSPQSFCSAFKPIQSPIFNEQSESQTKSPSIQHKYRIMRNYKNLKIRHRSRSFITNVPRPSESSPQLYHNNTNNPNFVQTTLCRSASDIFPITNNSNNNNNQLMGGWLNNCDDNSSSYGDYSDIDVAEIEIN